MNNSKGRSTRLHPNGFVYQQLPLSFRSTQSQAEISKLSHDFEQIVKLDEKMQAQPTRNALQEECDTPERKAGPSLQQLDNSSTIKKETPIVIFTINLQPKPAFKTPPKKSMTLPTLEELERRERQEREMNRRGI